jgi:hypothetical protein
MTNFERLPNEFFNEIFEYLDGYDIHKAFSNLNSRFEHFITCSSLPLKIKLRSEAVSELQNCCKHVVVPYRHRIFSLNWEKQLVIDDFFRHCILNTSFIYLQSIVIGELPMDKSMVLLFYLKSLPHLFSLTMDICGGDSGNLRDIYRMIFSLPSLKYNKLSFFWLFDDDDTNVIMPLAVNEQLSTIEHLVFNHRCTLFELLSILSHTPRLRHLNCGNLVKFEYPVRIEQPIVLSNLTYTRFDAFLGDFDEFEMSMANLLASAQILVINNVFDETYMDAHRWEGFIIKHMPHLRRFEFTYAADFPADYADALSNKLINGFASSFWIDWQWFFEIKIEYSKIHYSIRLYRYIRNVCFINKLTSLFRNAWLDTYKDREITTYCNGDISDNSPQPIQLSIKKNYSGTPYESFLDMLKYGFVDIQITRLNIDCENIPIGLLVKIIHLLPSLISLKVSYLPFIQSNDLIDDDAEMRFLTSINNKITNVNLEKIIDIKQVQLILYLCLRIQYFQVDIPKDMDLSMFLRFILLKASTHIPYLNTLCLRFSSACEKTVYQLQMIIESDQLLSNYMIKRIGNHILLKWN